MYFHLATKMADAIETLDKVSRNLKMAQIEGEDMLFGNEEPDENQATENIDA